MARIGLALGSGAARGWSHIGIIDALTEAGIEPEIVCGTSMGALVGAAYVAGRLADLRQWAEAASWREIVPLMDVRFAGGGLIDAKQVIEFLRGIGIGGPIESYAKTYAAVATDFVTGREIWLQSGLILEAVRASIALPNCGRSDKACGCTRPIRGDIYRGCRLQVTAGERRELMLLFSEQRKLALQQRHLASQSRLVGGPGRGQRFSMRDVQHGELPFSIAGNSEPIAFYAATGMDISGTSPGKSNLAPVATTMSSTPTPGPNSSTVSERIARYVVSSQSLNLR